MLTSEPAPEDKLLRAPTAMDTARHSRDDHLIQLDPALQRDQFAPGGGAPSTTSSKAPVVDFGDVFGGPPRRLSGNADAAGGDAGAGGSASVAEKPVFGSPAGRPRRRHLGDDFFSDIFRGDESAGCPTPARRGDRRDLFPLSSPATTSRVLTPTLHLPTTSDVFGGVSAVPAHLSYSSRLAKSFDYSSFRSPPSLALSQHGASDPDVFSVPSSPMVCAGEADKLLKKPPSGSRAYSGSGHFHFSIYKWASKGVTLLMPSSFKERAKGGSRLGAVSSQVWHREDIPLDNGGMSQGIHCFQNPSGSVEDKIPVDGTPASSSSRAGYSGSSSNEVTETVPAASDMRFGTSGSHARDSRGLPEEEGKPRLKNLHELINESSDQGEGDEVSSSRQTRRKEGLANEKVKAVMKHVQGTEKVKVENRKNTIVDCAETSSQERHSAPKILEEKVLPARAKGRVKEYIKTFNPEATEKTCSDPVETQTRGPKGKEKVEDCTSANSDQQDNGNYMEASSIPLCAGQSMKEERRATMKGLGVEKVDGSYPERIGASIPLSGSTPDSLDASFCNMEEVHNENIEELLVGELPQDHKEVTETDLHQEENKTKMSDTRIQEWSKGKEGNIRSLLSTLQYVLWTGCGWKPVPLVDIIEGASVRRAYQKALLCLHPDKLQQKGAETHQKYIAEKVFNTLQESWDYFNSLS